MQPVNSNSSCILIILQMTHAAEKLTVVLFTSKDDREQGPGFESIMLLF